MREQGTLEQALKTSRGRGHKLVVPYLTGGLFSTWIEVLEAVTDAGADAVEIGIPFSDPVMDGATIQEASQRALRSGATPQGILGALHSLDSDVPLVVMSYLNVFYRAGYRRAASWLKEAGVAGAIVPDLPLCESGPWREEAERAGVETVLLVGPTTPDGDLERICNASRGFVYAVGIMGVTGERDDLAGSALEIARRCKAVTDRPVLVGVGVSTPDQAAAICEVADGIVVGSALIRCLLDGEGAAGAAELVKAIRDAVA